MRKFIPVALLLALAACDLSDTDPETITEPNEFPLLRTWSAAIAATNGSSIAGTLEVRDETVQYVAQLAVANAPASTELEWRIFPGTCASSDDDEAGGSNQAYAPLTTDASGSASLTRVFSAGLGLDPGQTYNVRIMTDDEIEDTIACGLLQHS